MASIPVSRHVLRATCCPGDQQQENLDTIRQHILNAAKSQYSELTKLPVDTSEYIRHFSHTTSPTFRHIPIYRNMAKRRRGSMGEVANVL